MNPMMYTVVMETIMKKMYIFLFGEICPIKMPCRRLTADDVNVVCMLAVAAFNVGDTYDKPTIKFCNSGQGLIDTKGRGYALYEELKCDLPSAAQSVPTLVQLAVSPNHRRQGVAQSLIRAVLDHYKRPVYLHVRSQNVAAQKLYIKLKFVTLTTIPKYYNHTSVQDNAYYMVYIPILPTKLPPGHTWRRLT